MYNVLYYKFSSPTEKFFLVPAESSSLRLHQKGPSGQSVNKGYFAGRTDNGLKGVRLVASSYHIRDHLD